MDWNEPPYYELVRKDTKGDVSAAAIERSILASWKPEWESADHPYYHEEMIDCDDGLEPVAVRGWAQHMLRYQRLMLPKVEINRWLVRMWNAVHRTVFMERRKIANFIGSKNSGKSNFFALFCVLIVSIDPKFTRAFISGPYKSAADSTIWGRCCTRASDLKAATPRQWANVEEQKARQRVVFDDTESEAGYIELITLDKVGKLQGTKSKDPDRGWLVLVCDEIAEFPSSALLDGIDNLTANRNLLVLTGCNFKNVEGLEGDLCRPEGREYADLRIDEDHEWLSNYKSVTFRFDGHLSPNVLTGRRVSRHLLTEDVRADMEDIHGLKGPKYLEQVRSFPNSSVSDYFIITKEKIRAACGYDEFVWVDTASRKTFAFCDPGFGGDPCKIGAFATGTARVQSLDGEWHDVAVFAPVGPIETIHLDVSMVVDEEMEKVIRGFVPATYMLSIGSAVTIEQQIVIGCHQFMQRNNITKQNFGYDGSMRAGIVHEMVAMLGPLVQSLDFGGQATERPILDGRKTARDQYTNFVSEMWFEIAVTMQSRQFRGAELVPAAIAQLVRRPWSEKGGKKQIQPKSEYKADNQGNSPNDADVLAGAHELARRAGFRAIVSKSATGVTGDASKLLEMMGGMRVFSPHAFKKLNGKP